MKKFTGIKLPKKHSIYNIHGTSKEELGLANLIHLELPTTPIYRGDRVVLHGKEIDIWIPSLKLGFEFHGNYFHSDKPEGYHLYKALESEKQGVRLIQIFEDEWLDKKPLVVDLVRRSIGKFQILDLESCRLLNISDREGREFFLNSHLEGHILPKQCKFLGLTYNSDLVYLIAYTETEDSWIIEKESFRRGLLVKDALLAVCNALKEISDKPIKISISRRLFDSTLIEKAGFEELESSRPNKFYTKDYKIRYPEIHMTESITSEWKIIYDAGSRNFIKK